MGEKKITAQRYSALEFKRRCTEFLSTMYTHFLFEKVATVELSIGFDLIWI